MPISSWRGHNAEENGGWDSVDLWNVDEALADDMLVHLVRESHRYPGDLGFEHDRLEALERDRAR